MPDDDKATEQEKIDFSKVAEEEPDESEAAFGEDEEPEKKEEEKKPEEKAEKEEKKQEPKEGEAKKEEEPEKKEEKQEKQEPSLKEKVEQRAESIKDEEGEEEPPEKKEEPAKKEEPEKKAEEEPKPLKIDKEFIADQLKLISNDDLPEEVIIGDESINLKQYAKDYPDDYAAIRVISSVMAQKIIDKAMGGLTYAKPEDVDTKVGELGASVAQLFFENAVSRATDDKGSLKHADYYNIVYGEGKDAFHAWVKEQPAKIQKLANSLEPEDGILILDYYKEDVARKKTADHDKKTKSKKDEYDAIYKSEKSVRKNQQEAGVSGKTPDEEAEEAFDEED